MDIETAIVKLTEIGQLLTEDERNEIADLLVNYLELRDKVEVLYMSL